QKCGEHQRECEPYRHERKEWRARLASDPQPQPAVARECTCEHEQADESELLSNRACNEVVELEGQEAVLLESVAEAHTKCTAGSHGNERLVQLVPARVAYGRRVH